jgi:hypothetical protein
MKLKRERVKRKQGQANHSLVEEFCDTYTNEKTCNDNIKRTVTNYLRKRQPS